ncbi:MAG: hypothetical protein J5I93_15030 [Pirellulaceae bacterium]|nr:hypothetical protein [Pirellulaceae bacterium]
MKKWILLSLAVGCACWNPREGRAQEESGGAAPGAVSVGIAEPLASPYDAAPVILPPGAAGIWWKYPAGHLWTNYCEEHLHHNHGSCHQRLRKPACGTSCAEAPGADCRDCSATPACDCGGGAPRSHLRQRPCGCEPMVDCPLCAISDLFQSFRRSEPACAHATTCARPAFADVPSGRLTTDSTSTQETGTQETGTQETGTNAASTDGAGPVSTGAEIGPIEVKPDAELPRNVIPPSARRTE